MSAIVARPSFSVVLPTVNRGELFRSALESLIPQLEAGDELIISINGPERPVTEILADYTSSLPAGCLRIVHPPEKLTIYRHWNAALGHATGDWIVFIHDDEIVHSGLLAMARREIARDSGISLLTGATMMVDVREGLTASPFSKIPKDKVREGRAWIAEAVARRDLHYSISCYIFKRLPKYPYFASETRVADWLLMLDAAARGKVLESGMFFSTHLLHASNQSWVDYLTPGQIPFWRGLESLDRQHNLGAGEWVEHVRGATCRGYVRNALLAALPVGDRSGFVLCLGLAEEADSASRAPRALRILSANGVLFRFAAAVAGMIRKSVRRGRKSRQSAIGMSEATIAEIAEAHTHSPDFVRTWLQRARCFNAQPPRPKGVDVSST